MIATLLALIVTVGAQAADDPAAIVAKAIKAHGGKERLGKFQAQQWKSRGVLHMGEMKLPYACEYAYQQPNQLRFVMTAEVMGNKVELTVVSDGKQAWEKGLGMIREMPKEKYEEFRHTIHLMRLCQVLPLTDKSCKLTAVGESKVEGRPAVGIKVSVKGQRDVTLYFDKKTNLLVKSESRVKDEFSGKEVTQETLMLNYKEKDGKQVFEKLVIKHDGKPFIEEEFSDLKFLEKLDPKLFEKPQ